LSVESNIKHIQSKTTITFKDCPYAISSHSKQTQNFNN
jgi:hypothetical protein